MDYRETVGYAMTSARNTIANTADTLTERDYTAWAVIAQARATLAVAEAIRDLADRLAPRPADPEPFRPTVLMRRVSDAMTDEGWLTQRDIENHVVGNRDGIRTAIAVLIDEGYIEIKTGPERWKLHRLVRPFENDAAS